MNDAARVERERIGEIQHARILAAMRQVACEHGAAAATVARVVARAGVSRRTFYEEFGGSDDCFLAALDQAFEDVRAQVLPLYEQPGRWRERVRAGLAELLRLFDEQPSLARVLVVESLAAGPRALERRNAVVSALAVAVDAGREEAAASGATQLTAEGIVGAVLSLIHKRLCGEKEVRLSELLNPLMSMIVLPYLGAAQARRELDRPAPEPAPTADETSVALRSDPFKDAGMRITYRTMTVLGTIAAHPGASNRRLGEAAGVGDQGQMSKLLARLQRLGLVRNEGTGHMRGEPNAWSLTDAGSQLHRSIRAHTGASAHSERKGRE